MSGYDHGPLRPYEIVWRSGHVETIHAHQVLLPPTLSIFGDPPGPRANRLTIHGEVEGRWMLLLDVDYADVLSVRMVSAPERAS